MEEETWIDVVDVLKLKYRLTRKRVCISGRYEKIDNLDENWCFRQKWRKILIQLTWNVLQNSHFRWIFLKKFHFNNNLNTKTYRNMMKKLNILEKISNYLRKKFEFLLENVKIYRKISWVWDKKAKNCFKFEEVCKKNDIISWKSKEN